jgi:hypothetical protein
MCPAIVELPRIVEAADGNAVLRQQLDNLILCGLDPLKASEAELDRLARVRKILMQPMETVVYKRRARRKQVQQ